MLEIITRSLERNSKSSSHSFNAKDFMIIILITPANHIRWSSKGNFIGAIEMRDFATAKIFEEPPFTLA